MYIGLFFSYLYLDIQASLSDDALRLVYSQSLNVGGGGTNSKRSSASSHDSNSHGSPASHRRAASLVLDAKTDFGLSGSPPNGLRLNHSSSKQTAATDSPYIHLSNDGSVQAGGMQQQPQQQQQALPPQLQGQQATGVAPPCPPNFFHGAWPFLNNLQAGGALNGETMEQVLGKIPFGVAGSGNGGGSGAGSGNGELETSSVMSFGSSSCSGTGTRKGSAAGANNQQLGVKVICLKVHASHLGLVLMIILLCNMKVFQFLFCNK